KYGQWEYWEIPVLTGVDSQITLRILSEKSEIERQKLLKKLKEAKDWKGYINLDKAFDYCLFSYAITTHKAQGSSIDFVFLDISDIRQCPDLQKMQYTALTRTKKRAYIPSR
ncbi:MAG: C-terminal helicase domain-containing protein, partial [Xenococcaceae cyanobacterium]